MRHNKTINHLGRTSSHRKALLSNMASSLILNKRITTTVAKAKELRKYVEPLITKAIKVDETNKTHNYRVVFSYLGNKYAVTELFTKIAGKIGDRPGGYSRILRTGNRLGDNAEMCIIELVDFNDTMLKAAKKEVAKKSTRRSRGGAKPAKNDNLQTVEKQQPKQQIQKEPKLTVEKEIAVDDVENAKVVDVAAEGQNEEFVEESEK